MKPEETTDSLLDNAEIARRGLVLVKIPKTGTQSVDKTIISACVGEPCDAFRKYRNPHVLNNRSAHRLLGKSNVMPHIAPWTIGHRLRAGNQILKKRTTWDVGGLVLPNFQVSRLPSKPYRIMTCHWPWRYDPTIYSRVMVSEDPIVITLLREPKKRILSTYFYRLRRAPDREESEGTTEDFHRYLQSYDKNYYTRWFSWPSSRNRPDKNEALRTIRERITLVGTTDRLDDFMQLLSARLKVSLPAFHENPTKKVFGLGDLPPRTIDLLDEVSMADQELYAEASRRFDAEWQKQNERA